MNVNKASIRLHTMYFAPARCLDREARDSLLLVCDKSSLGNWIRYVDAFLRNIPDLVLVFSVSCAFCIVGSDWQHEVHVKLQNSLAMMPSKVDYRTTTARFSSQEKSPNLTRRCKF